MSEISNITVYLTDEQAMSVGINPAAYRGETAIPNLQAGTVGVGEDAQDVSVTITGEYPDYYLNFILPPGQLGKTPVFSIGSVTTGAAPSVTITGTDEEPVQNLVLPIAPTPDIKIGTVTDGDAPGVTISGTPENPVLNFTQAKGEKGDIGVTPSFSVGDVTTGANPEVDVTGTAENPVLNMVLPVAPTPEFTIGDVIDGAAPDVTISGTVQEPVLNFTLPKGEKGDTGTTPSITIGSVTTGEQADAEITGSAEQPVLNLVLPVAPTPEFSVGDVVDGTAPDVTITGTVQEPVLNFTQARGEQGNGITSVERTEGTGAPGTADTYTITFTDGTTTTFRVWNGTNGTGAGDMEKSVYDKNNNGIVDVAEVANSLASDATITTAQVTGLDTAQGEKADQSALEGHINDTDNPHNVTAAQAGADPAGTASGAVSDHNASESAHSGLFATKADATALTAHVDNTSNPHAVTAAQVGAATTSLYEATLVTSGWAGTVAPYTQTIAVTGMLDTDTPIVDILQSGTESTDEAMRIAWELITRITAGAGSITVYASDLPESEIAIQMRVVR